MSNSNTRTLLLSAITSVGLAFGVVTVAVAASPAASVTDDPSYQAYQRLNGFSIPEAAGASSTPARAGDSRLSSYERYLNLNGFAVEQIGVDNAPTTTADQSLRDYQRLNGFL
jgi:hypothetical protein